MTDSVFEKDCEFPAELVELLANNGERVVGWIHSHPTWEANLSSVDQHMQCLLQRDDPRIVAVSPFA